MDLKARRTALGWSRKDLAEKAWVDTSVLQLLELGQSTDEESRGRVVQVLDAAEKGAPLPVFDRTPTKVNGRPLGDKGILQPK